MDSIAASAPDLPTLVTLIRLGATPITNSAELLDALGFSQKENGPDKRDYSSCSPSEKSFLELLAEPMSRDELIRQSGLSASEANTIVSVLEIKGLIKETMGEVRRI